MKSLGWCWAITCQLTPLLTLYCSSTARSTVSAWSRAMLQLSVCATLPICSTNMILLSGDREGKKKREGWRKKTLIVDNTGFDEGKAIRWELWGNSYGQFTLVVPVPGSSEVQRFGNCLPHLTAIEVERVSVGMRWELPTTAAHSPTLDQLPALQRRTAWLKVVLDGAGQVAAGEGAVVTWRGERKKRGRWWNWMKYRDAKPVDDVEINGKRNRAKPCYQQLWRKTVSRQSHGNIWWHMCTLFTCIILLHKLFFFAHFFWKVPIRKHCVSFSRFN